MIDNLWKTQQCANWYPVRLPIPTLPPRYTAVSVGRGTIMPQMRYCPQT